MNNTDPSWEERIAKLWSAIDSYDPETFVARIDALAAELPTQSSVALFQRASAQDSAGHLRLAIPLYRAALVAGLSEAGQRSVTIYPLAEA